MNSNFIVTFASSEKTKEFFNNMRYNELKRKLSKAGCLLLQHGKCHDIWLNPANGERTAIPRHGTEEVPNGTLKSIYKRLGL